MSKLTNGTIVIDNISALSSTDGQLNEKSENVTVAVGYVSNENTTKIVICLTKKDGQKQLIYLDPKKVEPIRNALYHASILPNGSRNERQFNF